MTEPLPHLPFGTTVSDLDWNPLVDQVNANTSVSNFDSWANLTLATGWTNFVDTPGNETSTQPRLSWTSLAGVVWLRGVIVRTGATISGRTTIATFPVERQPNYTVSLSMVLTPTASVLISVLDGAIQLLGGSTVNNATRVEFRVQGFPLTP